MIQVKQLKRLKYESFDYGKYEKLKRIFLDPEFEPEDIEEIELSNEKSECVPNKHCLSLLVNLQSLVLSHNLIRKFNGYELAKACPRLQLLDMTGNLIEDLDDLVDVGSVEELKILDFSGNYVTSYISRINLIQQLLCPKKYVGYDAVRILTAGYNKIPVARLTDSEYKQQIEDRRVIERLPEELRPDELINTVSKYNHKNTLGKYSLEPCPTPRKTRFKNLEYLNGVQITKLDIMRVTGVKHFKLALEQQKRKEFTIHTKGKRKNQKVHDEYIKKYLKRINRMMEDDTVKVDEFQDKKKVEIDRKKYAVWETPEDVKYKDAEFCIGIEDFKKEQREHEEKKRQTQSQQNIEEERELKRLFRVRKKQRKRKMNLSYKLDKSYRSSESSLSESQQSDEQQLSESSSDEETTVVTKMADYSGAGAMDLKAKLQKKKLEEKKKVPLKKDKQLHKEKEKTLEMQHTSEGAKQPQVSVGVGVGVASTPVIPKFREVGEGGQETLRQAELHQLHTQGPSAIFSYNHSPEGTVLQVQQFRMGSQPVQGNYVLAQEVKDAVNQSFNVKNKLSAQHQVVTVRDLNHEKEQQLLHQRKLAMQERQELEEMRRSNDAFNSHDDQKDTQQYQDLIHKQDKLKNQDGVKNFWREMERVKVVGDLNKTEFKKTK